MIDYSLLKVAGIGLLSAILYSHITQLRKIIQDSQKIQKAQIKSIQEIQEAISKKQNSNLHLLKLTPYYFQMIQKKVVVRTAQKYKYEPSDSTISELVKVQLSTKINFNNNKSKETKWFAKVQHPLLPNSKRYQAIEGFGKVQGDFLKIQKQYTPKKKLNIWQRFTNWIYQKLYEDSYLIQDSKHYGPLFLGPVVGFLNYQIDLMKDIKILAVCNIEDGKIIPQVTATSKSQILNYYRGLLSKQYIWIGTLVVGTILLGRWLWSDIKAGLNAMKIRNNVVNNKYFKMQVPSDDKACIICYNNSRNMIFFDCRHMILCHDCSQTYESDVCPYCKMEIDDLKPVIGIS